MGVGSQLLEHYLSGLMAEHISDILTDDRLVDVSRSWVDQFTSYIESEEEIVISYLV